MSARETCEKKQRYPSRRVALKSLAYLKHTNGTYAWGRVYRCSVCKKFHITGGGRVPWPLDQLEATE